MKNYLSYAIIFLVIFSSCKKEQEYHKTYETSKKYLFLGHTRTQENPKVVDEVYHIDFNKYDMLWLGGDLAYLTSNDDSTMMHIDEVFNVKDENTLWAIGNHDYSSLDRISEYTNRKSYFSFQKDNITFLVLDTQDSLSNIIGQQKIFFDSVINNLANSTHLIVLHHKLIWMYGDEELEALVPEVSNTIIGPKFYNINPNNFYTDIYPSLVQVKNSGIDVLCVAGDIGKKTNQFYHHTKDSIHFIASGITYESPQSLENLGLVFYKKQNKIIWDYKKLEDL